MFSSLALPNCTEKQTHGSKVARGGSAFVRVNDTLTGKVRAKLQTILITSYVKVLRGRAHADPETRTLPEIVIIESRIRIQVKDIVHAPRSVSVE